MGKKKKSISSEEREKLGQGNERRGPYPPLLRHRASENNTFSIVIYIYNV